MSEQLSQVTDTNITSEARKIDDYSEYSWSIISEVTARLQGTPYAKLWRTSMEKFSVTRSISDTQKELGELVANAPLPPDLLKSRIEPFLSMPTSTQDECEAARLRLHAILDTPCYKFPPDYPTTYEMEVFRENLKKLLGPERENQFWKTYNEFPGNKGANTKESNAARQELLELLGENDELLEVFKRNWPAGNWEVRFIPSGSYGDGL
ncbi:uncharacterized protein EAF02_000914 [Botrytis sinoallii]|uniref:uncharacterized protein n=1 Tax=Botrytis sinoallii TaxID=1463999 RepID=UPI0019007486|nr:uncharacterized protein EAF02_000914 [Botrytis sinoallii]KAF7893376.1 hypothetical protein EAF02_000914 [Botrytis sinoallii]